MNVRFDRRLRSLACAVIAAALVVLVRSNGILPASELGPCDPPTGSPIVCENQLLGSPDTQWDIAGAGDPDIQGFATDISVDQGQTVSFKVKSTTAYGLDIYRMGYYQGNGARKVASIPPHLPTVQDACLTNTTTGLVDCGNWAVTDSWLVPTNAVSGIYFAKATRTAGGGGSHIFFIVRDDDGHSDVLFQTSDTTWQAYNQYGGNSLYVGSPAGRAYKVSYNRPFTTRGTTPEDWVFNAEYPMVRWLEANGYNVSYSSGLDSDRSGAEIREHRVFLSVGHDEYWSGAQRANVEAARNAGVDLAFFSGNEVFWKTRWEPSIAQGATPNRTLVSYKETHANAQIDPLPGVWTGTWRDPRFSPPKDGGKPENALTGTIFMVNGGRNDAITVPAADGKMRFWRNTPAATLGAGQIRMLPTGTLGYEWDEDRDNGSRPAGVIRLSDTTLDVSGSYLQDYGTTYGAGVANHAMTLYRHSSGALVFGAGTIQYSWGLDVNHDGSAAPVDPAMQQATVNLFADMGVQPLTLSSDLAPASPSTDLTAPASAISSPAGGASVPANSTITISGTAGDIGGGTVGGVEISTDGGVSWHRATGRATWTYAWQTGGGRTVTLLSRAVDDSGNLEVPGVGRSVTVGTGTVTCPCSIWQPTQTPAVAIDDDNAAVEIGTRFRADTNGNISAIRFFKSVQNVGPFVGNLWTSGGTLLATVPFNTVTASGWQEAALPAPVAIAANTSYVVSDHTNSGFYFGEDQYFATTGVDNGPLHALRDGQDGANGVYRYGATAFPNQTYNSENYWVDVVFVTSSGPDTTPPQVASATPSPGASGVAVNTAVTATFNENVNATTVTGTTFQLRDAANAVVNAAVTYAAGSRTATLQPSGALSFSTTYTATVRGGSTGVKDAAGNALATDFVWLFTTAAPPPPPPNEGTGGPILVVASAANPFTRYYAEILRNEGLNAFLVSDLANVTSGVLSGYDVVILGEMPLTAAQVTMFSDWVTGGGNLIAMRPDKKLASLLGLAEASGTLSDAYLLVDTGAAPGAGIVSQTMQFHGTADRYTVLGASAIANLYSAPNTATSSPAVTVRTVGASGGQAAAFTYDLARSVVYTRQGNPAWAGQERDSQAPIRSDDLFFGGAQADWIDRSKVAIPQADEQQRLLGNLIQFVNADRKPLPHFWYLPRGLKAAVVMTGDDHGNNGTAGRFDIYTANSPAGCSVTDWQCVRSTSYIYASTPIAPSQAAAYVANGFEIGVHITTNCSDFTPASLENNYAGDLSAFAASFPGLPAPRTNRTHCITWSDYDSQPQIALAHGIRFDTNYYYWPGSWVNDVPGLFTGSGMPMRFAKVDGTLIDVYQSTTQMTDESDQSYPLHIDTLLDRALGPEGYYGVFTANMHTDNAVHAGSEAIVSSAQARGVPIVSSRQMLDWLDGRNGSSFGNLTWSGATLSFSVSVGAGANGLQMLVPAQALAGPITGITRNGTPAAYTLQTVKGITYATVTAAAGAYQVQYTVDNTPPAISALTAAAGSTSATISWTTNEPSSSLVNFGTSATTLNLTASSPGLTTSHSVVLNGLAQSTQYFYQATSVDAANNGTTQPPSPATFTTVVPPPPVTTVTDATSVDFAAGTSDVGIYLSATADGEVSLAPTVGSEFSGTSLPSTWTSVPWNAGGATPVTGGALRVDGARANTTALFGPGAALEFVATFGADAYQHAGLADTLDAAPWAIFSTGTGGALYARTNDGTTGTDTLIAGSWLNQAHRYRIEWTASNVMFLIDGAVAATHPVAITANMRPIASDYNTGGTPLVVDWMRMSPYASAGTFTSRVLDASASTSWRSVSWTASTPASTSLSISARFGNTPNPDDGSWPAFTALSGSATGVSATSRYVQYRASLASTDNTVTPVLADVTFSSASVPPLPAISIADLSIAEGNSNGANAVLTLTLSASSTNTVTVNVATADGTATAGTDYTAISGTATFAPGATSTTVSVPIVGDTTPEPDETFVVNLTSPSGATIADGQAVVTITNDDAALPTIAIGDVSQAEGNIGTSNAVVTLTLSTSSTGTVSVAYATANGTATAGSDYTAVSGTATFAPGATSATINIPVAGDLAIEANETFVVNLTSPAGATIADAQATVTIVNDDLPSITIGDLSKAEGNSGTSNAVLTLTLSASSPSTVTVAYATANGTATAGSDYTAVSGTATFAPGTTTTTVAVPVAGNTTAEVDETFTVNLTAPVNATIADAQAVVTITNDDVPSLTIGNRTVTEGNTGTVAAAFTVTLSGPISKTVTVNYTTGNGTALAASDYTATSGSLTFAPGVTTQTINVLVLGDTLDEPNETFTVGLSTPVNAVLGATSQGTGTITDDDPAPGISIGDFSITEGSGGVKPATFTLTLSAVSARTVTVGYATTAGTASAAAGDYTAVSGTATFAPGATSTQVAISLNSDLLDEPDETFNLDLSNATNATITDSRGVATILDDDPAPSISIADITVNPGTLTSTTATFTVRLSAASGRSVTVNYATANGTAIAGSDYTAKSGTVTVSPGATTATFTVTILRNVANEPTEAFVVNLSGATNAAIADSQATCTITNN